MNVSLKCIASGAAAGFALLVSASAFAGPSTFETLDEANANSAARVALAQNTPGGDPARQTTWIGHPILSDYPKGTTFVYRSAGRYENDLGQHPADTPTNITGDPSSWRLNTCMLVFSSQHYAGKDDALFFLKSTGLTGIIDQRKGSIVLVSPIGSAWGPADGVAYLKLQQALFDGSQHMAPIQDFGCFALTYAFATDPDASTYFDNTIATNKDASGRFAAVMTIGGIFTPRPPGRATPFAIPTHTIGAYLPAYLVDAGDDTVSRYLEANELLKTPPSDEDGIRIYAARVRPAARVLVAKGGLPLDAEIAAAWTRLMNATQRPPILQAKHYTFDESPFYLSLRDPFDEKGRTADGIQVIAHENDQRFAGQPMESGSGGLPGPMTRWYEYIPSEYLSVKASDKAAHTVPVLIELHGGGDDPRTLPDECGWLVLQGKERFIIVSPEQFTQVDQLLVYLAQTYPAVDLGRVYVSGFSAGALGTQVLILSNPLRFAAAAPISGAFTNLKATTYDGTVDELGAQIWAKAARYDLPLMFTSAEYDSFHVTDRKRFNDNIDAFIDAIRKFDEFPLLKESDYDFDKYMYWGFPTVNNRVFMAPYDPILVYQSDLVKNGMPMMRFTMLTNVIHALNPMQAEIVWDYVQHFRRDPRTGAIIYTADITPKN